MTAVSAAPDIARTTSDRKPSLRTFVFFISMILYVLRGSARRSRIATEVPMRLRIKRRNSGSHARTSDTRRGNMSREGHVRSTRVGRARPFQVASRAEAHQRALATIAKQLAHSIQAMQTGTASCGG
jgi:hypothetical protein